MSRKELTKTFMMTYNCKKKRFQWFIQQYFGFVRGKCQPVYTISGLKPTAKKTSSSEIYTN